MTRSTLAIVVVVVGVGLAGGLVLIGIQDDNTPERPPAPNRSATGERGPEAENHSAGDLPAVERAARRFLGGYLPLIYGKPGATITDLRGASARLLEQLRAEGGHVTPAQAQRTPRLQRVSVIKQGVIGALATAQIKDSPSPAYPLVFHLQKTPQGWVVTRIGGP